MFEDVRRDFPILNRKVNDKRLVYLDNAATSQKPQVVIDTIVDYYKNHNANVHRGVHTLSEEATSLYENARETVAKFINARSPQEIIFTKGTTDSINLVSISWGIKNLLYTDTIAFTELEHHSNMVPWQELAKKIGCRLKIIEIDDEGFIKPEYKKELKGVKILAISHVSNVLGTIQNIKEIVKVAHENNCLVLVDGAQAVPHLKVDVQSLGCDFYTFSGHKMLGPMGIGVLYIRKELMGSLNGYQFGGGMIKEVELKESTYINGPEKFEAGTPNVEGAVGLMTAINYLNSKGMENIKLHEEELLNHATSLLSKITELKIYGPKDSRYRGGVISFSVTGIHPHDLASVLDSEGVAIRSGHHCAMPLHKKLNLPATARVSFSIYNTKEEIDVLCKAILKSIRILG